MRDGSRRLAGGPGEDGLRPAPRPSIARSTRRIGARPGQLARPCSRGSSGPPLRGSAGRGSRGERGRSRCRSGARSWFGPSTARPRPARLAARCRARDSRARGALPPPAPPRLDSRSAPRRPPGPAPGAASVTERGGQLAGRPRGPAGIPTTGAPEARTSSSQARSMEARASSIQPCPSGIFGLPAAAASSHAESPVPAPGSGLASRRGERGERRESRPAPAAPTDAGPRPRSPSTTCRVGADPGIGAPRQ